MSTTDRNANDSSWDLNELLFSNDFFLEMKLSSKMGLAEKGHKACVYITRDLLEGEGCMVNVQH
jgi:hypothetical protein